MIVDVTKEADLHCLYMPEEGWVEGRLDMTNPSITFDIIRTVLPNNARGAGRYFRLTHMTS